MDKVFYLCGCEPAEQPDNPLLKGAITQMMYEKNFNDPKTEKEILNEFIRLVERHNKSEPKLYSFARINQQTNYKLKISVFAKWNENKHEWDKIIFPEQATNE